MAHDQLRAQQQQQAQQEMAQSQPAPQPVEAPPPQVEAEQVTPNAERRISELIDRLRQTSQELQQAQEGGKQKDETIGQMQTRLQALEEQHNRMIQENLDNLDPETRMQVLQDARMNELLAQAEQRIVGRIMPHLQTLDEKNRHAELVELSQRYPAFDVEIHGALIDTFRQSNPACSIEQAFRAVAKDDELVTQSQASAAAVPPIVPPGNGVQSQPRYVPQQESKSSPEEELRQEMEQVARLRRSQDPAERKAGDRLMTQHLANRLSHKLPGR
jgi:hypothetical protein